MPLEVFYSYAHEDEGLRDELDKHLRLLQRQNLITGWHDRRIGAGGEWREQIDEHINSAHIILLLISPDFINSDYAYEREMQVALARHSRGEAIVIPIILRPVNWKGAPFGELQALPRDGKPVTTWTNRDEVFAAIAEEIQKVVLAFQSPTTGTSDIVSLKKSDELKERILDAAIPSHIVKGEPTSLLVLIRLPDSSGLKGILTEDNNEARPEDVLSKKFNITFPHGFDGNPEPLRIAVQLTSPDFLPPVQSKNILVPPDADSDTCEFILTPTRVGSLRVLVELQWEEVTRGQRRLITDCVAEAVAQTVRPVMNVVQIPIAVDSGTDHISGGSFLSADIVGRALAEEVRREAEMERQVAAPMERREAEKQRQVQAEMARREEERQAEKIRREAEAQRQAVRLPSPPPPKRSFSIPKYLLIGVIGIALIGGVLWKSALTPEGGSATPDVYRLRVIVLDPQHTPVTGATLRTAALNDTATNDKGIAELTIPRATLSSGSKVTIYADLDSAGLHASKDIQLAADPNPSVTIELKAVRNAVISGLVEDDHSRAIGGATVSILGGETALTGPDGAFTLKANAAVGQEVRLHAEKAGYQPVDQDHPAGRGDATIVLTPIKSRNRQ